jgi:hypothetical protein
VVADGEAAAVPHARPPTGAQTGQLAVLGLGLECVWRATRVVSLIYGGSKHDPDGENALSTKCYMSLSDFRRRSWTLAWRMN